MMSRFRSLSKLSVYGLMVGAVAMMSAVSFREASAAAVAPDSPSLVLERYLGATLNFRFEEAYGYLSTKDRRGLTVEEYTRRSRQMSALIVLLSQQTEYRVVAERSGEEAAEVEVEVVSPSFENLEIYEKQLRSTPELRAHKHYEAEVQKELIRAVKAGVVPRTKEVHRYRLVLEEGEWRVSLKG